MNKRRAFSAQFKLETVLEGLRGEKSNAQICRERDITDSLYYKWRDEFMESAPSLLERLVFQLSSHYRRCKANTMLQLVEKHFLVEFQTFVWLQNYLKSIKCRYKRA
jgi:transposase-like protein